MPWNGLEYLKVPEWRAVSETADVIYGVDVTTGRESLVFGGDRLQSLKDREQLRVLRVSINGTSEDLELLQAAACEIYRGPHDPRLGVQLY